MFGKFFFRAHLGAQNISVKFDTEMFSVFPRIILYELVFASVLVRATLVYQPASRF